jgi:hypothetical protein
MLNASRVRDVWERLRSVDGVGLLYDRVKAASQIGVHGDCGNDKTCTTIAGVGFYCYQFPNGFLPQRHVKLHGSGVRLPVRLEQRLGVLSVSRPVGPRSLECEARSAQILWVRERSQARLRDPECVCQGERMRGESVE